MNRGSERIPEGGGASPEALDSLYREGLRDMIRMRESVNDPDVQREIQALINEMRALDPKRFPGNPALLERVHSDMRDNLQKLELVLRRKLEDVKGTSVRSGAGDKVPAGYADSVAEYFRKLSK